MNKLITTTKLRIELGDKLILKDIDFSVSKGDYIGLLGPNGAGKTTLIKALLGLIPPTAGKIEKKPNLKIGYVPQKLVTDYEFFPTTVKEIIQLGANKFNINKYQEVIEFTNMAKYQNEIFANLSGGLKQRVIIARTLINDIDLLVLDEPTNGVDVNQQKSFYQILKKLNQQGVAIILISHDIEVVAKEVKQIVCINQTILNDCPIEELVVDDLQKIYGHNHHLIQHHH